MDLLGGYDSDASSSDEGPSLPSASATATATATVVSMAPQAKPQQAQPSQTNTSANTNTKTKPSNINVSKKGKRLLRLNAVLPPEILERLTRSTVQGSGGYDDGSSSSSSSSSSSDADSDNDNDNNNNDSSKQKQKQKQTRKQKQKQLRVATKAKPLKKQEITNAASDKGLNSLLSELQGFSPSKKAAAPAVKVKETLGMAFMNVTSTTVVRQKRNDISNVVDIHESSAATRTHSASVKKNDIVVEDVDSSDDDDDDDDSDDGSTGSMDNDMSSPATAEPLFPAKEPAKPSDNSSNSSRLRYNVPRPNVTMGLSAGMIKRVTNAAPSVSSSSYNSTMATSQAQPQPQPQQQRTQQHQTAATSTSTSTAVDAPKKKRSKRELEKALRAGNFDGLDSQKIDSMNYAPPNEQQILAASGAAIGGDGTGTGTGTGASYRTSGLERYVPTEGMSIAQSGLSGKMKGKHQIHSLVSSAAKHEADQRRMAAMGTNTVKSNRADAKRKYGW